MTDHSDLRLGDGSDLLSSSNVYSKLFTRELFLSSVE